MVKKKMQTSKRSKVQIDRSDDDKVKVAPMIGDTEFFHRQRLASKDKLMDWLFPKRKLNQLLINMELRTGDHTYFFIDPTKADNFTFKTGTYVIDAQLKYYNIQSRCYTLDYHQDMSIPVIRRVDVNELKQAIKAYHTAKGEDHIINTTNPSLLKEFINSKVLEGVMRGQQISEWIKKVMVLMIIAVIIGGLHLILFVVKSGMLNELTGMF